MKAYIISTTYSTSLLYISIPVNPRSTKIWRRLEICSLCSASQQNCVIKPTFIASVGGGGGGGESRREITNNNKKTAVGISLASHAVVGGYYFPGDLVFYPGDREIS